MSFKSPWIRFPRVILLIYFISLCFPGMTFIEHPTAATATHDCANTSNPTLCYDLKLSSGAIQSSFGFSILLQGMFGVLGGIYAWYANVLFAIGYILVSRKKNMAALIFSLGAFLLGLQAFTAISTSIPSDEGGVMESTIISLSIGYYIWLFSFLLLAWYSFKASSKGKV
jgi:hypothetical protein